MFNKIIIVNRQFINISRRFRQMFPKIKKVSFDFVCNSCKIKSCKL